MTKKNKHLLKLLSLSLLPIAAISIPAVVLTSCSSGKEESSDNSNNNQPNNPGDNGGEDNNNPAVTNPTYPTFASADEVRKACDEAKIDSKYESEPTFITTHSNKIGNKENYAVIDIYYPQDEMFGNMNYMYVKISNATNFAPTFSTNFADYPIYAIKDGQKYYINPNKAVLLDKIPELYMLSDEQLKNDSLEVQEVYKKYRNNELWFKVDVSDIKEDLKGFLPNSDNYLDWFFIDWNEIPDSTNDWNKGKVSSFLYDEHDFFSLRDLWTYRLSNDMRFGLTDIFGVGSFVDMDYYDNPDRFPHPTSTTYNPADYQNNAIDPNSFGGVVAMKYLKQHPNAVRFIDSITFNAGVSEGGVITSDDVWNNNRSWNYFYIKKSNELEAISSPLNNIKDTYNQYSRGEFFPSITIDAKKMYDNVDLSSLQLKKLENGINWYVPDLSTNLIDLLLTVNNNKVFGDIGFPHDFNNNSPSIVWDKYGYTSEYSIFTSSLKPAYYYPNFAVQDDGVHGYYSFDKYLNSLCYSTFTINFNQPNSK